MDFPKTHPRNLNNDEATETTFGRPDWGCLWRRCLRFVVPGQSYRLSLSLGANGQKKVSVTAGNQGTTLIFDPPNRLPNDWGDLSYLFTANSASTPISITGASGGSYLALDNVSVVPEVLPEGLGVVFVDQLAQKLQL